MQRPRAWLGLGTAKHLGETGMLDAQPGTAAGLSGSSLVCLARLRQPTTLFFLDAVEQERDGLGALHVKYRNRH
jgi:hypothetical protein